MNYLIRVVFIVLVIKCNTLASTYDFHKLDISKVNDICFNCHILDVQSNPNISNWKKPRASIGGTINNFYDKLATPDAFSKTCLLCHDGSDVSAPLSPCGIASNITVRTHPVFIDYKNKHDLNVPSKLLGDDWLDAKSVADLLHNNTIVCTSCHSPHNSTIDLYLRNSNTSSMLCLGCHNK